MFGRLEFGVLTWSRIYACFDGYPNYLNSECVKATDSQIEGKLASLEQNPNPVGPNCATGYYYGDYRCIVCKEGYVIQSSRPSNSLCVEKTNQPEGCRVIDEFGKCTGCNWYYGFLPTDSATTDCYKFDPSLIF